MSDDSLSDALRRAVDSLRSSGTGTLHAASGAVTVVSGTSGSAEVIPHGSGKGQSSWVGTAVGHAPAVTDRLLDMSTEQLLAIFVWLQTQVKDLLTDPRETATSLAITLPLLGLVLWALGQKQRR